MKEMIPWEEGTGRGLRQQPWTDLLDTHKPYLVLDQNSGIYHILYWVRHHYGPGGKWTGSDWYDIPNPTRNTPGSRKANSYPLRVRVWELPTVEYNPSRNVTGCLSPEEQRLAKKLARQMSVRVAKAKKGLEIVL